METSWISSCWSFPAILTCLIAVLYVYGTRTFDYFSKRKTPFSKPTVIIGNLAKQIFLRQNPMIAIGHFYNSFPNSRYFGFFEFMTPSYIFRDPQLIKQITVKDFDHFVDHRSLVDETVEPEFVNNLFALTGQKWRDMRSTLSPAFTGSKMKLMYTLVSDCAQQMAKHLQNESKSGKRELEMKDLFTRYTNDVIATCAFGIKVDSHGQPTNDFYKMGKHLTDLSSFSTALTFFGYMLFPKIMKLLQIKIFNQETIKCLRNIVLNTMEIRERENIFRPDMINLLMQARKGTLTHENKSDGQDAGFATVEESAVGMQTHKRVWTDTDIVAQALVFFFAGFDTISTLLSFTAYELAVNRDIQNKLLEEIDDFQQHGTPTYESIHKLKYLDMVITESLRKWPPIPFLNRVCVKSYVIVDSEGIPESSIEKGKIVTIPTYCIHHDPQYYPDPEKFDPERFSEENKNNIHPFTFIPFGVGPRNCIGSRFALMEAKAVLYHILSKFTFEVSSKTDVQMDISKISSFSMKPENGIWLELKPRTSA